MKGKLPCGHSDFLQDLVIALGRRMKSVRKGSVSLDFFVHYEDEIERIECLKQSYDQSSLKVVIWENGWSWYTYRIGRSSKDDSAGYLRLDVKDVYNSARILRSFLLDFQKSLVDFSVLLEESKIEFENKY